MCLKHINYVHDIRPAKKVGWLGKPGSILQLRLVLTRIEGTFSIRHGWNDIDSPMFPMIFPLKPPSFIWDFPTMFDYRRVKKTCPGIHICSSKSHTSITKLLLEMCRTKDLFHCLRSVYSANGTGMPGSWVTIPSLRFTANQTTIASRPLFQTTTQIHLKHVQTSI